MHMKILPRSNDSCPIKSEYVHNVSFEFFYTLIVANSHKPFTLQYCKMIRHTLKILQDLCLTILRHCKVKG